MRLKEGRGEEKRERERGEGILRAEEKREEETLEAQPGALTDGRRVSEGGPEGGGRFFPTVCRFSSEVEEVGYKWPWLAV